MAARKQLLETDPQYQIRPEDMSTQELVSQAVSKHKDTTAAAKRGVQIIEETKAIQAETLANLQQQGQKMDNIHDNFDTIRGDVEHAEKVLKHINTCCLVGFCCPCLTDPGDKTFNGAEPASNKVDAPIDGNGRAAGQSAAVLTPPSKQQAQMSRTGPDTSGLTSLGYDAQARQIQDESSAQDAYLDQISKGLDALKFGAQTAQEELTAQNAKLDRLGNKGEDLNDKMDRVASKTAGTVRKAKKKASKDDTLDMGMGSQGSVLGAVAKSKLGM